MSNSPDPTRAHGTRLFEDLARWVQDEQRNHLSPEILSAAQTLLIDALACGLAGREEHAARLVLATVRERGGNAEATILGGRERTSLNHAVLANSTLIRALDLNDFYYGAGFGGHPSDNLAVALALAEQRGRSGHEFLATMVMGYEVSSRLQDLMDPAGIWDYTSSAGLACAAMAARLMKLDVARSTAALALGAVHGYTLQAMRQPPISEAKACAGARIAADATLGALLAEKGLTGPAISLTGTSGLGDMLPAGADLNHLIAPAGAPARLLDVAIKAYPCVGTAQALVGACIAAHRAGFQRAEDIRRLDVHLADVPIIRQQIDDRQRAPQTRESADHSLYYLAAIALTDGQLTPQQFERQAWLDTGLLGLMQRITLHADHAPVPGNRFPASLTLDTTDGRSFAVAMAYAPGHPRNRLDLEGAAEKLKLVDAFDARQRARLVAAVEALPEAQNLNELFEAACLVQI